MVLGINFCFHQKMVNGISVIYAELTILDFYLLHLKLGKSYACLAGWNLLNMLDFFIHEITKLDRKAAFPICLTE